jgi:arginine decarboxylase
MIKYKEFVIVSGKAEDEVSHLNAFDKALMDAGIAEQNIIPVSSILAENPVKKNELPEIPVGEMIHVVMAREDGVKGETISSGLICALGVNHNRNNTFHGIIAEAHGKVTEEKLKVELEEKIKQMAKIRKFEIQSTQMNISSIEKIKQKCACTLSVLVYRKPVNH